MTKATPIWQMRFWDRTVLVNKQDVKNGKCYLFFCCDKNYPDLYSYDGAKVKQECKLCSNGKIYCYQIPVSWLENEGDLPAEFLPIREREYAKYKRLQSKR